MPHLPIMASGSGHLKRGLPTPTGLRGARLVSSRASSLSELCGASLVVVLGSLLYWPV